MFHRACIVQSPMLHVFALVCILCVPVYAIPKPLPTSPAPTTSAISDVNTSFVFTSSSAYIPILWESEFLGHRFANQPLFLDVNGDGERDMVLASFEGTLSVLNVSSGRNLNFGIWPVHQHGSAFYARPIHYDVDLDGKEEIIFISSHGSVHFFSAGGQKKYTYQIPPVSVRYDWFSHTNGHVVVLTGFPNSDWLLTEVVSDSSEYLQLDPLVLASGIVLDWNADGKRDELVVPVNYRLPEYWVDPHGKHERDNYLVSALLVIDLKLRRSRIIKFLELSKINTASPCFLLSDPVSVSLHQSQQLILTSASGKIFAFQYRKEEYFTSLVNYPLNFSPMQHSVLVLSEPHSILSHHEAKLRFVASSTSGTVKCFSLDGTTLWLRQFPGPLSQLTSVTWNSAEHIAFMTQDDNFILVNDSGHVIMKQLLPDGGQSISGSGPKYPALLPCTHDRLLALDSVGFLHIISLKSNGLDHRLAKVGFTSQSSLQVDAQASPIRFYILTTVGKVVHLSSYLYDSSESMHAITKLSFYRPFLVRISLKSPVLKTSGKYLEIPIYIWDSYFNDSGSNSRIYRAKVYAYHSLYDTKSVLRPGYHRLVTEMGQHPLQTSLLVEVVCETTGRSTSVEAALAANVDYIYELPLLLYAPVCVACIVFLVQLLITEQGNLLPLSTRHTD